MVELIKPENYDTIKNSDYIVVDWNKTSNFQTVIIERERGSYVSARLCKESSTLLDKWVATSKSEYCVRAYRQSQSSAYRFSSFREMITWLAKKENGK